MEKLEEGGEYTWQVGCGGILRKWKKEREKLAEYTEWLWERVEVYMEKLEERGEYTCLISVDEI
jgi:hypothetical protein